MAGHAVPVAQVLVKVGATKALTSILDNIGIAYATYDGVEPNPTIEQVPARLQVVLNNCLLLADRLVANAMVFCAALLVCPGAAA